MSIFLILLRLAVSFAYLFLAWRVANRPFWPAPAPSDRTWGARLERVTLPLAVLGLCLSAVAMNLTQSDMIRAIREAGFYLFLLHSLIAMFRQRQPAHR